MWSQSIRYELLERLGEGGQGCVFKALRRDPGTELSQVVALKVLHSETAHTLWKQEFESLRRVRSRFCVQVLSFDRVGGRPALVLEYVDGASLEQLGRSGVLDDSDIAEVVAQVEQALMDLNHFGIFHGDLSPANVLVDREGQVKLLDFGLANSGGTELRLTPDFAAPERLAGQQPSLAADLYSLGAIQMFLRGGSPGGVSYLARNPDDRRLLGHKSTFKRRRALARKVERWQDRHRLSRSTPTKTINYGTPNKSLVYRLMVACLPLLCVISPGAVPHHRTLPQPALIVIRTLNWHKIYLNGRFVGYAPIQIPIRGTETARLEWASALGEGRKVLRLRSGQRIVMGDRDFAH